MSSSVREVDYTKSSQTQASDDRPYNKNPLPLSRSDPLLSSQNQSQSQSQWAGQTLTQPEAQSHYYAPGDPLPPNHRNSLFAINFSTPLGSDGDNDSHRDDYDWSTDEDLVKEMDAKYEEELNGVAKVKKKSRRVLSWRTVALWPVFKLLATTFLGNMILSAGLIVGGVAVHLAYRNTHEGNEQARYTADNAEAWLFWLAFNICLSWGFHFGVELLPRLLFWGVALVWGDVSEGVKTGLERFQISKKWFKPILYAGCGWASYAVIFTTIFNLRSSHDPSENSRAKYTYRVYQVVELIFFAVLILCIEKFLILLISLNFHSVAYAERIRENNRALSILDRLKDYRPKRPTTRRIPTRPGLGGRGISTDGVGGRGWHTPNLSGSFGLGQIGKQTGTGTGGARSRAGSPHHSDDEADNEAVGMGTGGRTKNQRKKPFAGLGSWGKRSEGTEGGIPLETVTVVTNDSTAASSRTASRQNTLNNNNNNNNNEFGARFRPEPLVGDGTISTTGGSGGHHQHQTINSVSGRVIIADTPTPGRMEGSGQATPKRPPLSRTSTGASTASSNGGEPASIAKQIAKKKSFSTAEIARQAMKDPVATLGRGKGGLGLDITSPTEAKKLARSLFFAFRSDSSRAYLVASDFRPAFKSTKEANDAFSLFDTDGNGDITRTEIKSRVLQTYKERRALARSLQDVSNATGRLDNCFLVVGVVIFFFVCLAVFSVNIGKSLTTFYSLGIAAAFVFKNFATNLFDSVIFLFVTHAYDTGDRIFLDEEVLVVKQIQLLATTFTKWDGTDMWIPNFKLAQKFITNLRRSGYQFENATLQVGWDTTIEKLEELEKVMNNWLQTDEKRMFEPSTAVVIQHMYQCQYMEITVGMLHRSNWQDWGARWDRRTAFHMALAHYTNQLGITCYNSIQPVGYNPRDVEGLGDVPSGDEDDDYMFSPISPLPEGASLDAAIAHAGEQKRDRSFLGFVPPEGSTSKVRRRKLKSRKKAMRGEGAG